MLKSLSKVNSKEEFRKIIEEFNWEYFKYPEELIHEYELQKLKDLLDFNRWYFDFWFSDWLFIKNISDETYTFTLKDKKKSKKKLVPHQTMRFNFWYIDEEDKEK